MKEDRLERALREPGPRELGYVPTPLPAGLGARPRAHRGPTGALVLAFRATGLAAAVVAAVLLVAFVTNGGGGAGFLGLGASSSAPPPAAKTDAPASGVPASQTAGAAAPCRASDLAWSTDPWGGAAGSTGTSVLARGVASLDRCSISGSATVTLVDGFGRVVASVSAPASSVEVRAATVVEAGIHWSNWCSAEPAAPLEMHLQLPGDTQLVPLVPAQGSVLVPSCNGAGAPSSLGATAFQRSTRSMPEG